MHLVDASEPRNRRWRMPEAILSPSQPEPTQPGWLE